MRPVDQRSSEGSSPLAHSLLFEQGSGRLTENWRSSFPEIIGRSPGMQRALETVHKVAHSDSSVLILGESGTGKELIAAAIHRLSARSPRPYVPLNCSAIPDNLLESELFGHERGAFTGADRRKVGKFEYAEGGTIFLDEIGDMPPTLQAKLLRVLQDKKFAPLGGNELMAVDVRIIAATNMNLETAVKDGKFRLDLFYRLNVLPIALPPLRERAEDVPVLVEHFLEIANRLHSPAESCWFTDELLSLLTTFRWPGNVRQLQNLVERLVILRGGGSIGVPDLPRELVEMESPTFARGLSLSGAPGAGLFRSAERSIASTAAMPLPMRPTPVRLPEGFGQLPPEGVDLPKFIEGLENSLIMQALERTGQNRNQAAKLLGLNRTTLVERLKKRRLAPLNDPPTEL